MLLLARTLLILTCLFFQSGLALAEGPQFALQSGGITQPEQKEECDLGWYNGAKDLAQKGLSQKFNTCLKDKGVPKDSIAALTQVQNFDQQCNAKRDRELTTRDDLNWAIEDAFWQDIAKKSHTQSTCRRTYIDQYLKDPNTQKDLHDKVEPAFNQYKERLEDLGTYRAYQEKQVQDWKTQNAASGRGLFSDRVKAEEDTLRSIDSEIAGILSKIPMGHEPEVGARLMAMAMKGSFNPRSFFFGVKEARTKYVESEKTYTKRINPAQKNYCLNVGYKNTAAQSGQAENLIKSYDFLDKKSKAILQCRVSTVYDVGADRVAKVTTGFIIGGAILAAIPTEGTSLAVAMGAIGITASALGFIDQLEIVREQCSLSTYIISGQNGTCDPRKEFSSITQTNTMGSCVANAGLLAVGAVAIPTSILSTLKAVRATRLMKAPKPQVVDEAEEVVEELVVTASKPKAVPKKSLATKDLLKINRKKFTDENLKVGLTTERQNTRWNEVADLEPPPQGVRFLDTENAAVKVLNDSTLDKNFVTAMTYKHKQLVMDRIKILETKYPDVEFLPYSDFKSFRYAIRPKPPLKEIPKEVYSDINIAFKEANLELAEILKANKLTDKFNGPDDWFKAGFEETADGASDLSRWGRGNSEPAAGPNHVRTRTGTYMEARETDIKMAELYRGSIQSSMKGSPLLEESSVAGQFVPKAEVFDAVRKTKSAEETQKFIKWNTGEDISLADAGKLRKYAELSDSFSPHLRIMKGEHSVLDGKHGGFSIDIVGAGSKNANRTANATVNAKDIDEVLRRARAGEREVTALLDAKKIEVKDTVLPVLERHGIKAKFVASGDDITIVPLNKPMSDQVKKEVVDAIAKTKDPSSYRMGIVGTKVPDTTDRMILATTMEDIVKKTMLKVEVPPEIRKQIFISAEAQTTKLGSGQVKLHIGGDVSPTMRRKYEEAFKKAVDEINKTGSKYSY